MQGKAPEVAWGLLASRMVVPTQLEHRGHLGQTEVGVAQVEGARPWLEVGGQAPREKYWRSWHWVVGANHGSPWAAG